MIAARHEIVDHHAEIAVGAVEHDRLAAAGGQCGVQTRNKSLCRSLFIAGRAVDLAGQKQPRQPLGLQGRHRVRGDRHGRIRSHSPAGPS